MGKFLLQLIIFVAAVMGIAVSGNSTARESGGDAAPLSAGPAHKTLIFDLALAPCPPDEGGRINRRLHSAMASLPNLELVGNRGGHCRTGTCAVDAARRAGAHRVVYGKIAVSTTVIKKRVGDSGVERYIIKVDSRDTYRLTVILMDAGTGATLTTLTRDCKPEKLDETVDAMAASMAAYYRSRGAAEKETARKEEAADNEPIPEKPQPADDDRRDRMRELVRFDAALYFSFMVPVGSFSKVASFSFGTTLEGRARNLIVNNLELRLAAGYYCVSVPAGDVKSYQAFYGALMAGYRFEVYKDLYLTPLLGTGCQVHFLTNSNYNGSRTYADPLMTIRLGLDYRLYEGLHLAVIPGYMVLFEKGETGMYPSIDIGLSYSF